MNAARTKLGGAIALGMLAALHSFELSAWADTPVPAAAPTAPTAAPPPLPPWTVSPPVAAPSPEPAPHPVHAPATPPAAVPAPPPPPPPPAVTRNAVAWAAAGVAAVGAIGATVFGILALQNKSSYQQNPTFSNVDDGNNFAAYSDGCLFLAAAAGVTSLVLFLTSPPAADDGTASPLRKTAFVPAPVVMTRGGGMGAVLQF